MEPARKFFCLVDRLVAACAVVFWGAVSVRYFGASFSWCTPPEVPMYVCGAAFMALAVRSAGYAITGR